MTVRRDGRRDNLIHCDGIYPSRERITVVNVVSTTSLFVPVVTAHNRPPVCSSKQTIFLILGSTKQQIGRSLDKHLKDK